MPLNPEAEIKQLRTTVEALSRKVETLEKQLRALPDLAAIAKLGPRLDAAEKAIANKKDIKPEHEQAIKATMKLSAELQAQMKEQVTKAVLDGRFKLLEGQIQAALALAQSAAAAATKR